MSALTPTEPRPRAHRTILPQLLRGATMGAADIVPGVSGGTVALVLGIYRHLIEAIHAVVRVVAHTARLDLRGAGRALRLVPWVWLGALGVGILTMVFLASGPLSAALEAYPVELAGLFVGLIAGSVILCWRQIITPARSQLPMAALVAAVTFVLLGVSPASAESAGAAPMWAYFMGGAIAIVAMILPGISGSFLLVLMGLYTQVIGAVAERDLVVLTIFALGCATGLALASSGLRWLLHHHHDLVLASMVGLMVGSIRILWPWPAGLESTAIEAPTASTWLVPTLLVGVGIAVVLGVEALATRLRPADEVTESADATQSAEVAHAAEVSDGRAH